MSANHISFANIVDDNKIEALSLSDCPDADSVASIHDTFFMSSSSVSMQPSDPGKLLDMSMSSMQSSDSFAKHRKRRHKHHIHKPIVKQPDVEDPITVDVPKPKRGRPKKAQVDSTTVEVKQADDPEPDNTTVDELHRLTFAEFKYHPIKPGDEETVLKYHPDQLVIKLLPKNYIYECLTPYKTHYYEHNCPLIRNTAPTLDQYYQMFKVYRYDQLYDKYKNDTLPKDSFFAKLNKDFSSKHIIPKRMDTPKYWYHYNASSKTHEQWTMQQAQRQYCQLYQDSIFKDYESKTTFAIIHSYATHRDLKHPIIICGYNVPDSLNCKKPVDPTEMYQQFSFNYTFEYAFVEMLVNYPTLSLCSWSS